MCVALAWGQGDPQGPLPGAQVAYWLCAHGNAHTHAHAGPFTHTHTHTHTHTQVLASLLTRLPPMPEVTSSSSYTLSNYCIIYENN